MTELLTLVLSDFKHFIGTIILMACAGFIVSFTTAMIVHFIRGK